MGGLETTALTVRLGRRAVVSGVDLAVEPGRLHGLIGPNGAGKTTLLRALAGLEPPAAGRIMLDGVDLAAIPAAMRARRIGYLAQAGAVAWPVAAERLVALGRLPHLAPWQRPGPADEAAVRRALADCEVADLAARPVTTLSGGERARVLLARLLAGAAPVILADEPVAGLDPYHQLRVMALLKQRAEAGAGVAVVLHDLTLAGRFCDELTLLAAGRVAAAGTPAAVLQPDRLARIYGVSVAEWQQDGQRILVPWQPVGAPAPQDQTGEQR